MATPTQAPANTTQAPTNSSKVLANNSQDLSTSLVEISMKNNADSCEQSASTMLKQVKRKRSILWDSFVRSKSDISSNGKFKVQCTL
ncbi:hypothetical protein P3S68_014752 [Capsicum galapagoense]